MKRSAIILILFLALAQFSCSGSGSDSSPYGDRFSIDIPSIHETNLGEKRDFYVMGTFSSAITRPGNIRVELFRGQTVSGVPIRVVESHVDEATGITPLSAIDQNYANGKNYGLVMVPDIIREPGGLYYPGNKVVVTKTYYAALILGGATKDFDTTYTDSSGKPLVDLTAGDYTLRVSGISGESANWSKTIYITFGANHKLFGRFKPTEHYDRLVAYGRTKNLRIFLDLFPGYFWIGNQGYEVNNRWRPNNSLESVNTLPGIVYGPEVNALNDVILYNINATSATQQVELGAIVASGHTDSPLTTYLHYSIGEPSLKFRSGPYQETRIEGIITPIATDRKMVFQRAEITSYTGILVDNLMSSSDDTIKTVDTNVGDGIQMRTSDKFALYGVVKPIPSTVTLQEYAKTYSIDNRIAKVRYKITNSAGVLVDDTIRDVNLGRIYDMLNPSVISLSVYEFKHEFHIGSEPGIYMVEAVGMDVYNNEIPGTRGILSVNTQTGQSTQMGRN